jgi:hypothetical protein
MQQIKFHALIGKTGLVNFFLQIKTTFFFNFMMARSNKNKELKWVFNISFDICLKFLNNN